MAASRSRSSHHGMFSWHSVTGKSSSKEECPLQRFMERKQPPLSQGCIENVFAEIVNFFGFGNLSGLVNSFGFGEACDTRK